MKKTALHTMLVVGLAILFAGCAVLTVDVDVYKGPLANHEDVQMEQMAAMAIGAKPLLVLLRDTLEANYMRFLERNTRYWKDPSLDEQDEQSVYYKQWGKFDMERRLAKLRQLSWYKAEFVPDFVRSDSADFPRMSSPFLDSTADYVNNVLSLYKDVDPNEEVELSNVYMEVENAICVARTEYAKSYDILRPKDMKEDKVLAKRARDEFERMRKERASRKTAQAPVEKPQETSEEKGEKASAENAQGKEEPAKDDSASKLLEAYDRFLCQDRGDALGITKAVFIYLKDSSPQSPMLKNLKSTNKKNREALEHAAIAAYQLLVETEFVDDCADEIFGLKEELKAQFVNRVKQIAGAYLRSRATLENLWLVTLEGLIDLKAQQSTGHEVSDARAKYVAELTGMSLEIMQPRYMAVLLDVAKKKSTIDDLAVSLGDYPSADPNEPTNRWQYERMKQLLQKRLTVKPSETAKLLKTIHEFCKSDLDPERASIKQYVEKGDLDSLGYREGWRFGLVRPPFEQAAREDNLEVSVRRTSWTANVLGLFSPGSAAEEAKSAKSEREFGPEALVASAMKIESLGFGGGGFAHGRLNDGLETLIEKYLKQTELCGPNNDGELRIARQRLSDALVHFAQKMLFVANNKSLVSPPKSNKGLISGTLDLLSRGIVGDRVTDWLKEARPWGLASLEDTDKHTLILQAVGNSILVQADALHQERRHGEQLKEHYEKEEAVLRATLDRISLADQNPADVNAIKVVLSEYSAAKGTKSYTAKDIRDVWITLLEYEHDLALRNGDKARAGQARDAINAARKKREGMIFIRPAMAYLRTSFPATSLQANPNLTWDNMLGGHAARSIPFAPQIGEFLDPDAKRNARITAEIDKQFWQNINRVRVAGGGNTNYAVVKDDIGNWYVKGYSSNSEDIIESAKNLAIFAAGGTMDVGISTSTNQTNGTGKAPETSSAALEPVLDKYRDEYRKKTAEEYKLLYAILNEPNTKINDQIRTSWDTNEQIKSCSQIQSPLRTSLDGSYTRFLESFVSNLKDDLNDTVVQREQIVEGIQRLKFFRYDLILKIGCLNNAMDQPADPNSSSAPAADNEQIERAKVAARRIVEDVIEDRIYTLLAERRGTIKTYEGALIFLAEATQQKQ